MTPLKRLVTSQAGRSAALTQGGGGIDNSAAGQNLALDCSGAGLLSAFYRTSAP